MVGSTPWSSLRCSLTGIPRAEGSPRSCASCGTSAGKAAYHSNQAREQVMGKHATRKRRTRKLGVEKHGDAQSMCCVSETTCPARGRWWRHARVRCTASPYELVLPPDVTCLWVRIPFFVHAQQSPLIPRRTRYTPGGATVAPCRPYLRCHDYEKTWLRSDNREILKKDPKNITGAQTLPQTCH